MIDTHPGAEPFPAELIERIAKAASIRSDTVPRTRHREGNAPRYTNRLALESSPYLQQHAHNPVNWYPWGTEPFAAARSSRRPIFLSIGYSTCHWCHVMEEESFEDLEIAQFLNEHYVCIKVDREERPDVDAVYMAAVQLLTGGGGWPMSVWLNADREPFFAGTYFPARDGDRRAPRGFLSILQEIAGVWNRDPLRVSRSSNSLASAVRSAIESAPLQGPRATPGPEPIELAVDYFDRLFDQRHGGLQRAPKFPSSLPIRLLLRHHRRTRSPRSLEMATLTLEKMAAGGICDQLGGGFHRYSTDPEWLVPHFEKMLYDNALLAVTYTEAFQLTARPDFARVARQTLDCMLRDLRSPEGGFCSATDADSEGVEGRFFVWSEDELRAELGAQSARFAAYYGVTPEGNFEETNILHVPSPDEDEWRALAEGREKLRLARERRPHPLRDDKVLTAWNGLAISSLAFAGRVLAESRYVAAAVQAAEFLLGTLRPDDRLLRSWCSGHLGPAGFLEDHAFLTQGLIDLYEATFDPRWLEEALALGEITEKKFGDPAQGGWFRSSSDGEKLIAREKPLHDGAEPSGASVALLNALRLEAFTLDRRWRQVADRAFQFYEPWLRQQPTSLTDMLLALDFLTDSPREVVLVWPMGESPPEGLLEVFRTSFVPNRALAGASQGEPLDRLGLTVRGAIGKKTIGEKATAYVCERGSCQLPAIEPEELRVQLQTARPYR